MKNIDLSFITINYNSSNLTIKLVDSIISQTVNLDFEIIVVDNASKKEDFQNLCDSLNRFEQVKIIRNKNPIAAIDIKNIADTIDIFKLWDKELFDIFYYIIAIANDYKIDLEEIFYIKDCVNREKYKRKFSLNEAREEYIRKVNTEKNKTK